MEMPLSSELKNNARPSLKNTRRLAVKEKSPEQKHRQNLINRLLNDYFGAIIALSVIVILVGSYYFIILPRYQKIVATINATFYETDQLTPKYKELSDYQSLIEVYKNISPSDVLKVKGLVPQEYLKEDLFTEIIYLASTQKLTVNSLNISKDGVATSTPVSGRTAGANTNGTSTAGNLSSLKLPSGVGAFNVKLSLGNVDYPALKTWLRAMENSLRIIDVKSISFDPKSGAAVLDMTTYYLKK
ncbi:MAG: hypothetical protein WC564_02990 [Patescibacteria group bacterium]